MRDTLFSNDLLAFCTRKELVQSIIPVTQKNKLEVNPGKVNPYWMKAEKIYTRHRGLGETTPKSLLGNLNYNKKLEAQFLNIGTRVSYNTSGAYLSAAIVKGGTVIDASCYYYVPRNEDEAYYLLGVLNAGSLKIAYETSRESDRHFHTYPWKKVPIPRYNAKNPAHRKIADLARQAEKLAVKTRDTVQSASEKPLGQIKLSKAIREALREAGVMQKIDEQVKKILPEHAILEDREDD